MRVYLFNRTKASPQFTEFHMMNKALHAIRWINSIKRDLLKDV